MGLLTSTLPWISFSIILGGRSSMAWHVGHAANHARWASHTWGSSHSWRTVLGRWGHVSSTPLTWAWGLSSVVGMLQGMALQQSAVSEGPVAHVALESALSTMSAHVHIERAFLGEALATHGALEGPDTSMHHHVFEEVVTQGEGAPADGALMRFLT